MWKRMMQVAGESGMTIFTVPKCSLLGWWSMFKVLFLSMSNPTSLYPPQSTVMMRSNSDCLKFWTKVSAFSRKKEFVGTGSMHAETTTLPIRSSASRKARFAPMASGSGPL